MKKRFTIGIITLASLFSVANLACAQTRISSLPYTITASGQYYINNSLVSTGDGITVVASDVTIDLNGNSLSGNGTGTGVLVSGGDNVEVRNGSVRGFYNGISSDGNKHIRVTDVRAVSNSGFGIFVDDQDGCVIRNCTANNNQYGINAWFCLVDGNTAIRNTQYGIAAGFSQVIGNIARANGENGIRVEGTGGVVKNNCSFDNAQYGFSFLNGQAVVDGNSAYNNGINMGDCLNCTLGLNNAP